MNMFYKKRHTTKGGSSEDLILIVSIVLALGILWILLNAPERSRTNRDSSFISSGQTTTSRINSFFVPIRRYSPEEEAESVQQKSGVTKETQEVLDATDSSPYSGIVTIRKSSSGPRQTDVEREQIILNISSKIKKPITITGWKLQSMISNNTVTIPGATKVSTSGNINVEQSITVSSRGELFILTGQSPIGHSFQTNICSGYFEQFQDFVPSISKKCPTPEEELEFADSDPLRFGDACLTFIERLLRCNMPLDALPLGFPNSCSLFITEKINYSSCVQNHRNDEDFFKSEWYVYLKRDRELWNKRDIIRLLDENDKTVDVFNY